MRGVALLLLLAGGACSGVSPRWPGTRPGVLPAAGPPRAPADVWLSFARFPWHHLAGSPHAFPVHVSAQGGNPPLGGVAFVGHVRSSDQPLDPGLRMSLFCEWGPGKDDCSGDVDRGYAVVAAALGELRERAAAAGAGAVREVRCYARGERHEAGRLWCEGEAVVVTGPALTGPPAADLTIRPGAEPAPSRWSLGASATGGVYGESFVLGTTLHMRYRAAELAFHMVAPMDQSAAALGLELLGRHPLGRGTDLVFGAAGLVLAPLGPGGEADEAATELAVMPVLGTGWRPDLVLFGGYGQVFVDARAGWLLSTGDGMAGDHRMDRLTFELVVGLTTP